MKKRGFTLIELLIVISILGILAAALLPRFQSFTASARDAATRANLAALRGAIVQYYGKQDAYPSDNLEVLVPTYIDRIPAEKVSSSDGCSTVTCVTASSSAAFYNATPTSGWVYCNSGTYKGMIRVAPATAQADSSNTWQW